MNPSTLLGMILGLIIVALGIYVSSDNPQDLWNAPGLAIVIGGTAAATLMSYPLREVLRVFRVFTIILRNERVYAQEDMDEIVEISRRWFRADLSGIEKELATIRNPFLRTGVQMVVDGAPADDIMDLLQWRIAKLKAREAAEAQVFRSMAMYAPAFGMLGTLLGLANMLHGLQGDFEHIGANMAIALLTTLYGILLANLVFKPIAIKFERRTEQRVMLMNVVLEGIALMAQQRSPSFIRTYLDGIEAQRPDEIREPVNGTGQAAP